MALRKLRQLDSESAGVTLPKDDLRESGLLDDDGRVAGERYALIEQIADGEWRIKTLNLE
jgi:hypothetical protein